MIKFTEYSELNEKLILLSNGKKYGQICFLAGGAGSGKGFAAANFMEKEKFKVRDVDEWKKTLLKMANVVKTPEKFDKGDIGPDKYAEIKDLDLTKPNDVFKLHKFVDAMGIKDKTLDLMLNNLHKKEVLPNILFDITAKNINDIAKFMPRLLKAGYNPANIHLVWVLTNYQVSLKNNLDPSRGRIVPEDIMFTSHGGAAQTMVDMIQGTGKKIQLNGQIHVILNNRENTVYFSDPSGKNKERISSITGKKNSDVIKDFKYLTLKKRGKGMETQKSVQKQIYKWIVDNIPTGDLLKALIDRGVKKAKKR
ncbi:MAG: hypothetical protein HOH07_00025 [Euryarchaeota archaeon]|jgi:hypothetical protein|nr:hypothetical protein [Euryarchaeota archaeon]